MGKYDTNKQWSKDELLQFIANELAEANRLKRLEIKSMSNYTQSWIKDHKEELEDKA